MTVIEQFKAKAKGNPQSIVFPECDARVLSAANLVLQEGIGYPVLLGKRQDLAQKAMDAGVVIHQDIEIVDPATSDKLNAYVAMYCERRDKPEKIGRRLLTRPLYFGGMMAAAGDVKGVVAGADSLTATVVTAAQLSVGMADGISAPSSFFIMVVPGTHYGENGVLIYADAGVNPNPTPEELADIAVMSARNAQQLLGWSPRVAMLSFSTKGSASHPDVRKVQEATRIARSKAPDLAIDGEFQSDSAIVPHVAAKKVKEPSDVAGKANVLVFPDLDAANIAYKLTQYLAGAEAYGPLLQGFARPVNDLSRGASVDDIVGVAAITVVQAQQ
jgi:phosphate acetyltransferase